MGEMGREQTNGHWLLGVMGARTDGGPACRRGPAVGPAKPEGIRRSCPDLSLEGGRGV